METTNTLKNLLAIYNSMANIKEIDRSDYFKNYFNELKWRIESERQYLRPPKRKISESELKEILKELKETEITSTNNKTSETK